MKIIKIEFRKLIDSKLIWAALALVFIMCLATTMMVKDEQVQASSTSYFVYAAMYSVQMMFQFIIPVIMILLISYIIGNEYGNGTIKTFMISKVSKKQFFISKLLFIIMCVFILIIFSILSIMLLCFIKNGSLDASADDILKLVKTFLILGAAMLPIILIVAVASIFMGDFQKSLLFGIVFLVLLLSANSLFDNSIYSPTHLLNCSEQIFLSKVNNKEFLVLSGYIAALFTAGVVIFDHKDIWE